jgi:glycosyltransferase involved in cell wall biosynthesis
MHLIVNALSIGSMSGQHVVFGFLRPLAKWANAEHRISIIHYADESIPEELLQSGVHSISVPERHRHWTRRFIWELTQLDRIIRSQGGDILLNVSGSLIPNCSVRQAVLCQNPWCYVPAAQYGLGQSIKARLQRIGYRKAFRHADLMIYISHHLRSLYQRGNRGYEEKRAEVAYVGINESTFAAARQLSHLPREAGTILSVSAMAPWKGTNTLVDSLHLLRERGISARLKIVGPWPVASHRREIESQIDSLSLRDHIDILGRVSEEELHRLYATSEVFALLSSCESFGIPAAEAMCFGTPIVSTNVCAISEICEGAGLFGPVNNPEWAADALAFLLQDKTQWTNHSQTASQRAAELLPWEKCSPPLQNIFSLPKT